MQVADDLMLFDQMAKLICDPESMRWRKPFNDGTGWFISDGRILLWFEHVDVPDSMDCQRKNNGEWSEGKSGFRNPPERSLEILSDLPEATVHVPSVNGPPSHVDALWQAMETCDACSGGGYRECSMGHEHDCPDCDGKGVYPQDCEEAGEEIEIHGELFARRYVWILSQLPDVKMCSELRNTHKLGFSFRGGRGAVMSRVKNKRS